METALGKWIDNGDGTITDVGHRLVWIRAPWGMFWTGYEFVGEPISVSWLEATTLFGRGVYVEGIHDLAAMSEDDFAASSAAHGYTPGTCRVTFAGSSEWRLPTAAEWRTINGAKCETMDSLRMLFPQVHYERFWSANGRSKFEGGWRSIYSWFARWSEDDKIIAWSMGTTEYIDENAIFPKPLLFVRAASDRDIAAYEVAEPSQRTI